jgi:hypothetical protein
MSWWRLYRAYMFSAAYTSLHKLIPSERPHVSARSTLWEKLPNFWWNCGQFAIHTLRIKPEAWLVMLCGAPFGKSMRMSETKVGRPLSQPGSGAKSVSRSGQPSHQQKAAFLGLDISTTAPAGLVKFCTWLSQDVRKLNLGVTAILWEISSIFRS